MGTFKDVDSKAWYYNDVELANKYGLMGGTRHRIFEPNRPPTRAELAAISVRLYRLADARFSRIIDRVIPSVVEVVNFREGGLGSGTIIHKDGYVLTNAHVVKDAKDVAFRTPDSSLPWGAYAEGPVLCKDDTVDLAICKIGVDVAFPALPIEKNRPPKASSVIAIGSPLGLIRSVSEGIVSAHRVLNGVGYIQTEAEINPGNSGGALVNLEGRLVGVPTLKMVGVGIEGLGFCVNIEMVKRFILNQIINKKLPEDLGGIF